MSDHAHGADDCAAGVLIDRVNAAIEAIGASMEPGATTTIPGAIALLPLTVHTTLTADEADCLVSNMAEGALQVIIERGRLDEQVLRGLVGQAFLAGVFAGKDAS